MVHESQVPKEIKREGKSQVRDMFSLGLLLSFRPEKESNYYSYFSSGMMQIVYLIHEGT